MAFRNEYNYGIGGVIVASIMDEMVKYKEILYNLAMKKTKSAEDSEDLVQEVFLNVLINIGKGVEIRDLGSYLVKVLKNLIYKYHFEKNDVERLYTELDIEQDVELQKQEYAEIEAYIKSRNEDEINEEIAFMPKIYREAIDLYYFKKMKIIKIAEIYKVKNNTIEKRLMIGRKLIKEGVKTMKSYLDISKNPVYLSIGFSGISGWNGELDYLLNNLIEQNLLVITNNNPMTEAEIGKALRVSTVFVEEMVKKLVNYELLKQANKKYYTDFLILDVEPFTKRLEMMRGFTEEIFPALERTAQNLYQEHLNHGILSNFNKTQLYMFTVFSINYYSRLEIIEKLNFHYIDQTKEKNDKGKWMIDFGLINNQSKLYVPDLFLGGPRIMYSNGLKFFEWSAVNAKTFRADFNEHYSINDRFLLINDIYNGKEIEDVNMPLVYELIKYRFLSIDPYDDKKYIVNIPVITESDFKIIEQTTKKHVKKMFDSIGDKVVDIIKNNPLSKNTAKQSNHNFHHFGHLSSIAIDYLNIASEKGIVEINNNENYPVSLLIETKK